MCFRLWKLLPFVDGSSKYLKLPRLLHHSRNIGDINFRLRCKWCGFNSRGGICFAMYPNTIMFLGRLYLINFRNFFFLTLWAFKTSNDFNFIRFKEISLSSKSATEMVNAQEFKFHALTLLMVRPHRSYFLDKIIIHLLLPCYVTLRNF